MKIHYLQSEYAVGKHRLVQALYDSEVFKSDASVLSPHWILNIDEIDPANKALCMDLAKTVNKVDAQGEGKYYVNASGQLMQKEGWVVSPLSFPL